MTADTPHSGNQHESNASSADTAHETGAGGSAERSDRATGLSGNFPAPPREQFAIVADVLDGLLLAVDEGEIDADPLAHGLVAGAAVMARVAAGSPAVSIPSH